jgi:hypothetical protein
MLVLRKELIDNYRVDSPPIKKELSFFKDSSSKSGFSR